MSTVVLKNKIGHVNRWKFCKDEKYMYFSGLKRQKQALRAQKLNLGSKTSIVVSYIHRSGILYRDRASSSFDFSDSLLFHSSKKPI
jgi:hypothetical protein